MKTIGKLLDRIFGYRPIPTTIAKSPLERIHAHLGYPELRENDPWYPSDATADERDVQACIQQIQNYRAALETAFMIIPHELRKAITQEINWRLKQ